MSILLVGSWALKEHFPDLQRKPRDTDLIGTLDEVTKIFYRPGYTAYPFNKGKKYFIQYPDKGAIIEAELAWEGTTAEQLIELVKDDPDTRTTKMGCAEPILVPPVDVLYMLKMSHRYLKDSPHFLKTMRDIQFLRGYGAKITDRYKEFYKARMKETYWYVHPKLKDSKKDEFFTDNIKYEWCHDDVHVSVKHLDKPAYEYYKEDNEEVFCSKKKFFEVSEEIRLYGGLEEAYVLALERHQIPNNFKPSPRSSYNISIKKVASSITSGFFREWVWEHFDQINSLYNDNYVSKFQEALARGEVKPFNGKRY